MSDRRRVLKTMAGAMAVLAGCGGGGDDSTPDGTDTPPGGTVTDDGPDGDSSESDPRTPTRTCLPLEPVVTPSFVGGATPEGPDRTLAVPPGDTAMITVVISNETGNGNVDIAATLDAPWSTTQSGIPVGSVGSESFNHATATWELTVPESASGEHVMSATVTSSFSCSEYTTTLDQPISVSPVAFAPLGFNSGGWYKNEGEEWVRIDDLVFNNGTEGDEGTGYVSVSGDASASPTDTAVGHTRSDAEIASTDRDFLYRTAHFGRDLGYDVAIENGTYDVRLYFAENDEEVEPGDRLFDVTVQGTTRLEVFDVADQNEFIHAPVVRTFEGVEVTDGTLSITTESIEGDSLFSGFSIREVGGRKEG
jgi:hypothetical protein